MSGEATSENITDGVHKMKWISIFHRKKQIFCLFHAFNPPGRNFIKIKYSSFPLFPMAYPFRIATYYNITSSPRNVS